MDVTKETVAIAVRMEHDPNTDELYLVFKVTDPNFKKKIKLDWNADVELKLIGKELKE